MADVYWHRRLQLWSVREAGRVVTHVEAIVLADVAFRASEAGRIRCLRRGQREVVAWAQGVPVEGLPRPPDAVRVRYQLTAAGFRLADGRVVVEAAAAWFEADGTAWVDVVGFTLEADVAARRST